MNDNMWCVARVDYSVGQTGIGYLDSVGLFGLVWACKMKDLPTIAEVRQTNGFVCPDNDLVIIRPDRSVKMIDEA